MKLVLKSYSQDVNIVDPSDSSYYLTFVDEDLGGAELRLPVQQETIVKLVERTLVGTSIVESAERSADPDDQEATSPSDDEEMGGEEGSAETDGATVFGDEGVGSLSDLPELEDDLSDMVAHPEAPDSEDEVASL